MINYNKNKLINKCLVKYYETFALTLDTCDYVPEKFNKKILAYIFKNMKRQFRKVDREDRTYQRERRKAEKAKAKAEKAATKSNSEVKENENQENEQSAPQDGNNAENS